MRKLLSILVTAACVGIACLSSAQSESTGGFQKLTPDRLMKQRAIQHMKRPCLAVPKTMTASGIPTIAQLTQPKGKALPTMQSPLRVADTGTTFWGNIIYKSNWTSGDDIGVYQFTASNPVKAEPLTKNQLINASAGSALVGDVYYAVYAQFDQYYSGKVAVDLYAFDVNTWNQINTGNTSMNDWSMAATETATSNDGTVYGLFYNSTLTGFEWGVVDYAQKKRTTISTAKQAYVALGITNDNRLYGVAADGNLYKVDTSTGKETLVGPTGITVSSGGSFYGQSGEIDPKTNVFYWAVFDANSNSGLYTVDLDTGKATKVGDYDVTTCEVVGMQFQHENVADDAPGKATGVTASFPGGSTSGTIAFTTPATTYSGNTLSGSLNYYLVDGSDTIATGSAQPGEHVSINLNASNAMHNFKITTANAHGSSPVAKVSIWVGPDVPSVASDVTLNLTQDGNATVSWTAPKQGVHDGWMGNLTYDVYRYCNGKPTQVSTKQSATTYAEKITPGSMVSYRYGVVANNASQQSDTARSNNSLLGDAVALPYSEDFSSDEALSFYKVIDANNDSSTWSYYAAGQCMTYNYSSKNKGDDWLIAPRFKVKAGRRYIVQFMAKSEMNRYKERLEVKYGYDASPASLTYTVQKDTLLSADRNVFSDTITVERDGYVSVGFHAISDADKYTLTLDDIRFLEDAAPSAPSAVTNLHIDPDKHGVLKAQVSFNAPTTSIEGNALKNLVKIEVKRGDKEIKTFSTPKPGEALEFTDYPEQNGINTYAVTAYNQDGAGRVATSQAYVGVDVPAVPQNVIAKDLANRIRLSWDAVGTVGKNGGAVIPADVAYNIYNLNDADYIGGLEATTDSLTHDVDFDTDKGDATLKQFLVSAKNAAGESGYNIVALPVGTPYKLPMEEHFADGFPAYNWWLEKSGESAWSIMRSSSSDDDGGAAVMQVQNAGDASSLNSFKISLEGSKNPELIFDHYIYAGKDVKLSVIVDRADGTETTLKTIDYATAKGENSWSKEHISLVDFKNERFILIKFKAESNVAGLSLFLDDIALRNVYDNDMEVHMTAPKTIVKGRTASVNVVVRNVGDHEVKRYKVALEADGKEVAFKEFSEALASYSSGKCQFDVKTTSLDPKSTLMRFTARVILDGDEDESNNVDTASMALVNGDVPPVYGLTYDGQHAQLKWEKPVIVPKTVTEDFESYEPWSTSFGDWKMVDATSGGLAGSFFSSHTYPVQGTSFAFTIFNPERIYEGATTLCPFLTPHSGEQYASVPYKYIGSNYIDGNEWIISPQLSGEAQTISFYVRNAQNGDGSDSPETFEIYTSTTSDSIASMTKLGNTYTASGHEWTLVSIDVAAGTRYFAIHHNTPASTAMLFSIDDVTYRSAGTHPVGYNVYRDNALVSFVGGEDICQYVDKVATSGSHTYAITALYPGDVESIPATITTQVTSVGSIFVTDQPFDVYTVDGRMVKHCVKTVEGLSPGIYIINDKPVYVK